MSVTEFENLIAADESSTKRGGFVTAAGAGLIYESKKKVCRTSERLLTDGYIVHNDIKIAITDTGRKAVEEYLIAVDFIGEKLMRHCNTPQDIAFEEAVNAAYTLGEGICAVWSHVRNGA